MRILELLSSPVWTGPAEPMASVARQLQRKGHEVEMAVDTLRGGDLRQRLTTMGFTIRSDLFLSTQAGPLASLSDVRRLRRMARDFDILHAHFSHDHALALLAHGPARVVRTVHSTRSLRQRPLQGLLHRSADGLIAVCQAHAQLLHQRFGVAQERVLATRGAVDSTVFTPDGSDLRAELGIPAEAPVAGIVSRVKPDRRHAELVEAFSAVLGRIPQARLMVVGRGEGLGDLEAQVARRGLKRQVVFAGYRTGTDLAAAYRTLDVKVLLAEGNDGTCRAILEAMACGRPAVAYRFGAPAETIVDGRTGRLVEEGNREALTGAMVELLSSPALARSMGAAARTRVAELYTEEQRGAAVDSFLRRIMSLPPV